jgi:methyl-accepting chemotaxis protein
LCERIAPVGAILAYSSPKQTKKESLMLKNMKIWAKLTLVGTIIIAVPLVAVALISITRSGASIDDVTSRELINRAREIGVTIDRVYAEELKLATSLANNPLIIAAAKERAAQSEAPRNGKAAVLAGNAIQAALEQLAPFGTIQQIGDSYEAVNIMDTNGIVFVAATPQSMGVDAHERPYFKKAMEGEANIGSVVVSKVTGNPITPVVVPVISDGKVIGVFTMMLKITFLQDIVSAEKVGLKGYAAVIDGSGMVIAHPDASLIMKMNALQTEGMKDLAKEMTAGKTGDTDYESHGVLMAALYAPVQRLGWSVMLTLPDSEYMIPINQTRDIILLISAIALALAVLLYLLFARSITVPLSKGVTFAQNVAAGDFTQHLDIDQRDEVGALAGALNGMSEKLSRMVGAVQENAELLAASSEQISLSAQRLSEGAQTQASSLEETSASVEELTASVDQVAEHAQSQAAAAEEGTSSMTHALATIEDVSQRLEQISALARQSVSSAVSGGEAVQSVVAGINAIAASSEKIGGIVTVISDIADQTNLLALNASIEAARAGEHGRGFAVVADEVSKLADRSSSSTKEIEGLIRDSIRNVTAGVETSKRSEVAMEEIRGASKKVNEMIAEVTQSMGLQVNAIKELAKALENVSEMSQSISASTEEQTTNAKQVSQAVEGVNEITQSAASSAEEMSASTEQLTTMAQELRGLMSQFKITRGPNGPAALRQVGGARDEISAAIQAHALWAFHLQDAIKTGRSEFSAEAVGADDQCEFGKWLYARLGSANGDTAMFMEIRELHAEFHRQTGNILALALSGDAAKAALLVASGSEYKKLSEKLISLLTGLKGRAGAHQALAAAAGGSNGAE